MLEHYVSGFLAAYLGEYISGLSTKQLRVSLWNGELNLHHLELRPESLEPLSLPIVVHRGYVGTLKVTIPWTRLQSEPVSITMDGLYVVMRPKKGSPWVHEQEVKAARMRKQRALQAFELMRESENGTQKEQQSVNFMARMQTLIINNIQVTVSNVHIRYEDGDTDSHRPIAAGMHIASASMSSTDHDWNPCFVTSPQGMVRKLLSLAQLRVYAVPCPREAMLINKYPPAQHDRPGVADDPLWKEMLSVPSHSLIDPVDAHLRLSLQQGTKLSIGTPRLSAALYVGTIMLRLSREQYERLLQIVDYFTNFQEIDKFRKYRPVTSDGPIPPRKWWRFALDSVLELVRGRRERQRMDWEKVKTFKDRGRRYVSLWKRTQGAEWLPPLSADDERALEELEDAMSLNDIIWFRRMAYSELRVDEMQQETQRRLVRTCAEKKQPQGWVAWGWSRLGYATKDRGDEEPLPDPSSWSEEERQRLAAVIGGLFSEVEKAPTAPAGYIETSVTVHVERGHADLFDAECAPDMPFGSFDLSSLRVKVDLNSKGGSKSILSLGAFEVSIPGDGYQDIVTRCPVPESKPLLLLMVEQDPLDGRASLGVSATLAPMNVVLHIPFLTRVASFSRPPAVIDLEIAEGIHRFAKGLLAPEATTIDVSLDLTAPNFILPLRPAPGITLSAASRAIPYPHPPQGALVVMLGTIVLRTDLDHLASRRQRRISGGEPDEDDVYDKYTVTVTHTHAVIVEDGVRFMARRKDEGGGDVAGHAFLHPFDMSLDIKRLIPAAQVAPHHSSTASLDRLERKGVTAMEVAIRVDRVELLLSRQHILIAMNALNDTLQVVGRLSPEIPDTIQRDDLALFHYDTVLQCRVAMPTTQVLENPLLSKGSLPLPTVSGMVILHGFHLLLYSDDGQSVYTLRHIVNLQAGPFRTSVVGGQSIILQLPQAFGPPKTVLITPPDNGHCRALYQSLRKISHTTPSDGDLVDTTVNKSQMRLTCNLAHLKLSLVDQWTCPSDGTSADLPGVALARAAPFATMQFDGFHARIEFRVFDQSLSLKLREFEMREGDGEGRTIASSTKLMAGDSGSADVLVDLDYISAAEQSSLWSPDRPDTTINLACAALLCVLSPTFVQALELFNDLLLVVRLAQQGLVKMHAACPRHLQPCDGIREASPSRVDLGVKARMKLLEVLCMDEVSHGEYIDFLQLHMANASFQSEMCAASTSVTGELGNVVGERVEHSDGKRHTEEIVGVADTVKGSLITFAVTLPAAGPGKMTGHMRQIKSTFHFPFLQRAIHWATAGSVTSRIQQIPSRTLRELPSRPPPPPGADVSSFFLIDLHLENPLVALPPHPGNPSFLVAELGSVHVVRRVDDVADGLVGATVMDLCEVKVDAFHEGDACPHRVASNLTVHLVMHAVLSNPTKALPYSSLTARTGSIVAQVTERDWALLLQVAAHNILATYTPPVNAPPSQPDSSLLGPVRAVLDVAAETVHIGLVATSSDPFAVVEVSGMKVRKEDRSDGTGSLMATLQTITVVDASVHRALLCCDAEEGSAQPLLGVSMYTSPAEPSRAEVRVGSPLIHGDPDGLFRVQDHIFSAKALEAMEVIIGKATAPPNAVYKVAMQHMAFVGLANDRPLFKLTARDVGVELSLSGAEMGMSAHLGGVVVVDSDSGTEVMGMPSMQSMAEMIYEARSTRTASFRLRDVRAVAVPGFWQSVAEWASNGPLVELMLLGTSKAERLMRGGGAPVDIFFQWEDPHVVFPCSATETTRCLTATLGTLTVRSDGVDSYTVALGNVHLHHSGKAIGRGDRTFHIVKNIDASGKVARSPSGGWEVTSNVGLVSLGVNARQQELVTACLAAQAAATTSAAPISPLTASAPSPGPSSSSFTASVKFAGVEVHLLAPAAVPALGQEDAPLARFSMEGVVFTVAPSSTKFTLQSISVTDLSEGTPPDQRAMLTTHESSAKGSEDIPDCLVYEMRQKGEEDRDVGVHMRRLHIKLYRDFILRLHSHFEMASKGVSHPDTPSAKPSPLAFPSASPSLVHTRFECQVDGFTVGVLDGTEPLCKFTMDASHIAGDVSGETVDLHGTLGGVEVVDLWSKGSVHCDVVSRSLSADWGQCLAEFHYSTREPPEGFAAHCSVTMRSMTFRYIPPFIARMQRFFHGGGMQWVSNLVRQGAGAASEAAAEATKERVDVQMKVYILNPHIKIPEDVTRPAAVLLDLGEIALHNTVSTESVGDTETLSLSLTHVRLVTHHNNGEASEILDGASVATTVSRKVNAMQPDVNITCSVTGAEVTVSQAHWLLLLGIVKNALKYTGGSGAPSGGRTTAVVPGQQTVKMRLSAPVMQLTLKDTASSFCRIGLNDLAVEHAVGEGGRAVTVVSLLTITLEELWDEGSVQHSRHLDVPSGGPALRCEIDCQAPSLAGQTATQVLVACDLPRLILVSPLLVKLHDTFVLPYKQVFLADNLVVPPHETVIEEDTTFDTETVLTPSKVLRISNAKRNCITLDGKGPLCLRRDRGDTRPLIIVDHGITVCMKDLSVVAPGPLDGFLEVDEGVCIIEPGSVIPEGRVTPVPNGSPPPQHNLRHRLSVRVVGSFGVGLSSGRGGSARCVVLHGRVETSGSVEYIFGGTTKAEATLSIKELQATHLPPPTVTDLPRTVGHVLEPTNMEMILTMEPAMARAQVMVEPVHAFLCLGDVEILRSFVSTLPASHASSASGKSVPSEVDGTGSKWDVRLTCPDVTVALVDDTTGTPLPLFDFSSREGALLLSGLGSLVSSFKGTVYCSMRVFNSDACEWEPLVEPTPFEASGATSALSGQHYLRELQVTSTEVLNVNITPMLMRTAAKTLGYYTHLTTSAHQPILKKHTLYILRNECGRDLRFCIGGSEHVAHVPAGEEYEFDIPQQDDKFGGQVVHIAVVMNALEAKELTPPPKRGPVVPPWGTVRIGVIGKSRVPAPPSGVPLSPVSPGANFVADVVNMKGRKVLCFRTGVVVANFLSIPLTLDGIGVVPASKPAREADLQLPKHPTHSECLFPGRASVPHDRLARNDAVVLRPLLEGYRGASLGYPFSMLLHLPSSSLEYLVRCPSEGGGKEDIAFKALITQDRATGDVELSFHPIVVIENRLPVTARFTLGEGTTLSTGEAKGGGGTFCIKTVPHGYPSCTVALTLGFSVNGIEMQSRGGAVVWNRGEERDETIQMCAVGDPTLRPPNIQVHLKFCGNCVVLFAPLLMTNHTEHAIEVVSAQGGQGTILPPTRILYPVTPAFDSNTFLFRCRDSPESSDWIDTDQLHKTIMVLPNPNLPSLFRHIAFETEQSEWPETQIIRLVSRWAFHNHTQQELSVRVVVDQGIRPSITLPPGQTKHVNTSTSTSNTVEIRSSDPLVNNRFSRRFPVDQECDAYLRLNYEPHTPATYIPGEGCFAGPTSPEGGMEYFKVVHVRVKSLGAVMHTVVEPCSKPPFLIENRTQYTLTFRQDITSAVIRTIPPRTTIPHAFDDPFAPPVLVAKVMTKGGQEVLQRTLHLDPLHRERVRIKGPISLWWQMRQSSHALIDVVSITEEHYMHRTAPSTEGRYLSQSTLSLRGIGVSLSIPQEQRDVAYIVMQGIDVFCGDKMLAVGIGDLQIDDVSEPLPKFPVVLQRDPEHRSQGPHPQRFLSIQGVGEWTLNGLAVKDARVALVPLQLRIGDVFLFRMWHFGSKIAEAAPLSPDPGVPTQGLGDTKLYITRLCIEPISMTFSIVRLVDDPNNPFNYMYAQKWWVAYLLRSIEQASLQWNAYELTETTAPCWVVYSKAKNMYLIASMAQLYKVLGSLSALGNPAALAKGVKRGITDLVSLPFTEASKGENWGGTVKGGVTGLFRGVSSLITNTGSGLAGSVSSLTRSAAKTASRFSFDPEWMTDRQQHHRATGAAAHQHFAKGVWDGVSGVFIAPVAGFRHDGFSGAAVGVTRGAVGLFVKPVTGVLDGVSEGLDWWAGRTMGTGKRLRAPRAFLPGGVLCNYVPQEGAASSPSTSSFLPLHLFGLTDRELDDARRVVESYRRREVTKEVLKSSLSWPQLAAVLTWDEFGSICTPNEFYEHAHLARDRYVSLSPPTSSPPQASVSPENTQRVRNLYRMLGAEELGMKNSLAVEPKELALVTTWDEFRAIQKPEVFIHTAKYARDQCIKPTIGFQPLSR